MDTVSGHFKPAVGNKSAVLIMEGRMTTTVAISNKIHFGLTNFAVLNNTT